VEAIAHRENLFPALERVLTREPFERNPTIDDDAAVHATDRLRNAKPIRNDALVQGGAPLILRWIARALGAPLLALEHDASDTERDALSSRECHSIAREPKGRERRLHGTSGSSSAG